MVRWGRHLGVLILEGEQASKEEDVAQPAVAFVHGQKEEEEEKLKESTILQKTPWVLRKLARAVKQLQKL